MELLVYEEGHESLRVVRKLGVDGDGRVASRDGPLIDDHPRLEQKRLDLRSAEGFP